MRTKQLTKIINDRNTKTFNHWLAQAPAYIASMFSVIFAYSIIYELKASMSTLSLIIVSAFLLFFLLVNEFLKITNIRKVYKGIKSSLIPFTCTFLISVSIATISIYFLTNKSQKLNDNNIVSKSIEVNNIEQKYSLKIDSLQSKNRFESTDEYFNLKSNLEYWQNRKALTLNERNEINSNITNIQNQIKDSKLKHDLLINNLVNNYNKLKESELLILDTKHSKSNNEIKTTNFLTYLLIIIMLIVELGIIYLNKFIAENEVKEFEFSQSPLSKKYVLGKYILENIYLHKSENNTTNINVAKFCYELINNVQKWDETTLNKWDELKGIYNLYIALGILDKGESIEKVLTNNILINKDEALTLYDAHHEKFFSINFN